MAPEQFRGERADARANQFSFCVALYEALYGQRPSASSLAPSMPDSSEQTIPSEVIVPGWLPPNRSPWALDRSAGTLPFS